MTWIPALPPWAWLLLAAVPLGILLLYFLKLRREPVQVPSTFLWLKTIEDLHVNSLIQRLRRNFLLLLQLLAVLLAALALFRPGLRGETSGAGRIVYLLDTSASMRATDVGEDQNRFERARQLIADRIDTMTDDQTAMLIAFNDRANVLQSFTSDRRRLRDALDRAELTRRGTDVSAALRAADGLANPRPGSPVIDETGGGAGGGDMMPADLALFSDGGFQTVTDITLGNLVPSYNAVGSPLVNNLAVTAFSAERTIERPSQIQAFATVANLGDGPASTDATLAIGDQLVDAAAVELEAGEQTGLSFSLESDEAVALELALELEDDLMIDNRAYAGLTPLSEVSVLVVTPGNKPLELGLDTASAGKICVTEFVSPDYLESEAYARRAAAGADDLIIYDRCSPPAMPATHTFSIGALPHDGWSWDSEPGPVLLIDVDRTHPLMRYVELFSLLIFEGRAVSGPPGTAELVGGDAGPMLSLAPRDGYQDLVLGFDIITTDENGNVQTNTNWYAERSWPVFLLNVLRHLAGAADAGSAATFRPGETVRLRLANAIPEVTVRRVGGDPRTVMPGPSGQIEVTETELPGNYRVEADGELVELFAVNLFNRRESDLAVAPDVEFGYESVAATPAGIEQRREYWRWLLLAMLGMLGVEWWLYTRRVA